MAGKQTKLSNFFGALNKPETNGNLTNNNIRRNSDEISSVRNGDHEDSIEIKENLNKLSNEMDNQNKTKTAFKFRTKSDLSKPALATQPPSTAPSIEEKRETAPKVTLTKPKIHKPKFAFVDDDEDSLDELLNMPTKKSEPTAEIKPKPLFKISSKSTAKASDDVGSPLFKLNPKFTSTQVFDETLQKERNKKVYIAKTQKIPESTKNESATQLVSAFSFKKPKSSDSQIPNSDNVILIKSPQKSSETLKILDQLSSAISSIKESPSPIKINDIDRSMNSEKSLSLNSTPELKKEDLNVNSGTRSPDELPSSKLTMKLDNDRVMNELDDSGISLNTYDQMTLKDQKLKFLEYFYNLHHSIPLSTYDSVEGYNKKLALKLKGTIQSIDLRQRIKEHEEFKRRSLPTKPINVPKIPQHYTISDDEDEQFDIDQVMYNIEDEQRKSAGKFDNSYIDIANTPVTNTKFEPRINMKQNGNILERKPSPMSHLGSSQNSVKNVDYFETDDDGFPIIDLSQLEDVIPSQPQPSTSTGATTPKNTKPKKETVQSMIPDDIATAGVCTKNSGHQLGVFHTNIKNDGITGEFDGENHEFSRELRQKFQSIFGLRNFRQNQLQAINASLLGHDCFVLMPTGGGKSLCYQLPAVMSKGVTIVVSPLKSLILDQVNKLNSLDIKAAGISGDIKSADITAIYRDLRSNYPTIKLLYVTPEKISMSTSFQEIITSLYEGGNLARIVIDEAHCVSTWGHDFRPEYKRLGELKRRFPKVACIALTATANERVRSDVVRQLQIFNCKWFLSSFNRPNLKYIVTPKAGAKTLTDIIGLIKSKFPRSSGIIYCLTRKDCEQVAAKLQLANITAISYHAGMTDKNREKAQQDWITDKVRVVCATIAFGMGIDKPDVRYVIHYSMPKSIEGYYQESGRAGRDGALSTCILYYSYSDKMRYMNMMMNEPQAVRQVSTNNLDLVVNFCENMVDCRRTLQLNYFGEHFTREQCLENRASSCDNCTRVMQYKNIDATDISKKLVSAVNEICARFGLTVLQLVDVFKGAMTKKVTEAGHNKSKYHGCLKDWERNDIQRILHKLIIENYLREEIVVINDIPIPYVKIGQNASALMKQNKKVEFSLMEKRYQAQTSKKLDVANAGDDSHKTKIEELQDRLYHDLMDIARSIADERNLTIQQVINMEALRQMSVSMPETEEEMMQIPHITKANFMKYGKRFLETIIPYSAQRSAYEMDRADEAASDENDESDKEFDFQDSTTGGSSWSTGSNKGFKRKFTSFRGRNSAKKYKRSRSTGTKRKSPAKKAATRGRTQKAMMPPPRPTF